MSPMHTGFPRRSCMLDSIRRSKPTFSGFLPSLTQADQPQTQHKFVMVQLPLRTKANTPLAQCKPIACTVLPCPSLFSLAANNTRSRRSQQQQQQQQGQAIAVSISGGQTAPFLMDYWALHRIEVN